MSAYDGIRSSVAALNTRAADNAVVGAFSLAWLSGHVPLLPEGRPTDERPAARVARQTVARQTGITTSLDRRAAGSTAAGAHEKHASRSRADAVISKLTAPASTQRQIHPLRLLRRAEGHGTTAHHTLSHLVTCVDYHIDSHVDYHIYSHVDYHIDSHVDHHIGSHEDYRIDPYLD